MLITKYAAELCALFIDDIYGELPSRIFAALLNKGRSNLAQLAQNTSLTPAQIRHGLAVLIQHNLLYHFFDQTTTYEANPDAAYNLIRAGKIMEMVEETYGIAEREVMQSLFVLGHTSIGDLKDAYTHKLGKKANVSAKVSGGSTEANGGPDVFDDDDDVFGFDADIEAPSAVEDLVHLNATVCRLIEAELVDVLTSRIFQSPDDIYKDIEQMINKEFPGGPKGTKQKDLFNERISEELRKIRDEPKALKRKLHANGGAAKRRKLVNGDVANGDPGSGSDPLLDRNTVIRINYEKCLVELRNKRLTKFAADTIGETTAQVYAVFLQQLSTKMSRCRPDPVLDVGHESRLIVKTTEILDNLSSSINPSLGIGKTASKNIHMAAEKIRKWPDKKKLAYVEGDSDSDADGEDSDEFADSDYDNEGHNHRANHAGASSSQVNGTKESKVKFDESAPPKESRFDSLRQHLLLLAENQHRFLRHCGYGEWTVDFKPLIRSLCETELDLVVERVVGRDGLRLARILRDKGKLDEKTLPTLALMKKSDVQQLILKMQIAGYVDIQEVPRDAARTASRTLFLWFCDTDRMLEQLLDDTHKAMLRCMQIREVHRLKNRDVLSFIERSDVKGHEKEQMDQRYFEKLDKYLELEKKLLGHVMRLDDMVTTLRDF